MINFYSYKNKSYLASLTLIILTVIIIFFKGLNLGIDFKGGLNFEVRTNLSNEQILNVFQDINNDREIIVKKEIGSDVHTIRIETGEDNASFIEEINQLIKDHPEMEVLISEYIEPTFSDELIKNSLYAMASSLLVIAFYIWIRFDWQFAASGIFALLHDGKSVIRNYSPAEDPQSTLNCVEMLGAEVNQIDQVVTINGTGRYGVRALSNELDCGNSGTAMRLLSGVLVGAGAAVYLIGDPSLSSRTMTRVIEPLEQMGAHI